MSAVDWVEAELTTPRASLDHALQAALDHLATLATRDALRVDPIWRTHASELERILAGFTWERGQAEPRRTRGPLRAVAWNIERGKRWRDAAELLATHPLLAGSDLILLNEVDIGMARSGNVDVPALIARRLGMDHVYCNYELVLCGGDAFERQPGTTNTLGLHGAALLSRLPIVRAGAIGIPEFQDKFEADEKRLGGKRALLCEVDTGTGPLCVVLPHLDPFAPPSHRGAQMRRILHWVDRFASGPVLLGGDLNTNTYDLGTSLGLARSFASKMARLGFDETIRHYMTPERIFERATFEALHAHGLRIDGFNDRQPGSTFFDLNDPELRDWTERFLPRAARSWLERRLRPYDGMVPLRIDWFAGRGLAPLRAGVVQRPRGLGGVSISDHDPLYVRFALG